MFKSLSTFLISIFLVGVSSLVFAAAGVITANTGANTLNVTDNSCQSAMTASIGWAAQFKIISCSSDPIVSGTILFWQSPLYGDASWTVDSITATSSSNNSNAEVLDPAQAGAFFTFAMTSTLLFYFFCLGIGSVLKVIKRS